MRGLTTADAISALRYSAAPPDYKRGVYDAHWLGWINWRLPLAMEHLGLWAWRQTAFGRGPEIFEEWTGAGEAPTPAPEVIAREHGWLDIQEEALPGALKAHEAFLKQQEEWSDRLKGISAAEAALTSLDGAYDQRALKALLNLIRESGAEPLLYVAPRGLASPPMAALDAEGTAGEVLRFNLPERYPELNPLELRWDFSHLNAEGADVWSRLFAREFARHLDATGAAALRR